MSRIVFTVINDLTYDQRMHRICSSLSSDGHYVVLIGRKLKESVPVNSEAFEQKRLNLFFARGKLFYLEYNLRLLFQLLLMRFDVVCGVDLDTILPCYFASWLKRNKCVYDAHEIFPEVPEVVRRPKIQKMWRSVERFSVSRIRNCYSVSHGLANYFADRYGSSFEVIRNFPKHGQTAITRETTLTNATVIYQGALNEGRGLEAMIRTMQHVEARLLLVGEGDLSDVLRQLVKNLQLQDKVFFAGKKKPSELVELTNQASIGINLLENKGLNYYHSLANKFFDYVQAGIPQITMDFPEYRRMNEEYEVAALLPNLDEPVITAVVNRMLQEKDFYIRLRNQCLLARDVWTWEKEEPKLLSFYRNLK